MRTSGAATSCGRTYKAAHRPTSVKRLAAGRTGADRSAKVIPPEAAQPVSGRAVLCPAPAGLLSALRRCIPEAYPEVYSVVGRRRPWTIAGAVFVVLVVATAVTCWATGGTPARVPVGQPAPGSSAKPAGTPPQRFAFLTDAK